MDEKPKHPGKGTHPNTLAALEPTKWKKGQKPQGAGRPKGSLSLKSRFEKYMHIDVKVRTPNGVITEAPAIEAVCLAIMSQAAKGNVKAAQLLFDRVFGKEAEKVEVTGKDGDPLEFKYSGRLSEIEQRLADAFGAGQGLPIPSPPED